MANSVRFHLDENVNQRIANGLRDRGIDVTTTTEALLLSTSDSTQFGYAKATGRVLITHDTDFLRIAASDYFHPGIMFSKSKNHSIGMIVRRCVEIYAQRTAEEMRGHVEYL